MFAQILDRLVRDTGADLVIFCDYEGESIAFGPHGDDDYEVRVTGALFAASVLGAQRVAAEAGLTERIQIEFVSEHRTLLIEALAGGYYLLMALPPASPAPYARYRLREVAERFALEL